MLYNVYIHCRVSFNTKCLFSIVSICLVEFVSHERQQSITPSPCRETSDLQFQVIKIHLKYTFI